MISGMARTPKVPGKPRTEMVMLRLTQEGAGILDKLRGKDSRQDYLRKLLRDAYVRENRTVGS